MAALNQDFVTYKTDSIKPIFTVQTTAGIVVDISTATEITWTAQQTPNSAALITKKKSTGGITFVSGGTDGKFQVALGPSDLGVLEGYYVHYASVTDGGGNVTTVEVGRMQVGPVSNWSYSASAIALQPVYQVRRLIGDVLLADQQMTDQEIQWYIDNYSNVWTAAANAARALAAQFSRMVDTVQGEIRTLYSQRARNYLALATTLETQGKGRGVDYMYAGGISIADKSNEVVDTDRVPPQFNLMMFDNLLPVGPVGQQTPIARLPDAPSI